MLACHAGGPGSIPGRCKNLFILFSLLFPQTKNKSFGDAGYRSPYLSHAKRALYHLSYVPELRDICYMFSVYQPRQVVLGVILFQGHYQPIRVIPPLLTNNNYPPFDSSVGRAVDCSCSKSDIHRSLVQIRLEGVFACLDNKKRIGFSLSLF